MKSAPGACGGSPRGPQEEEERSQVYCGGRHDGPPYSYSSASACGFSQLSAIRDFIMPIRGALSEVLSCRPGSDRARTPPWSAVATGLPTAGGDRPAGHPAGLGRLSSEAAFRRFRRPRFRRPIASRPWISRLTPCSLAVAWPVPGETWRSCPPGRFCSAPGVESGITGQGRLSEAATCLAADCQAGVPRPGVRRACPRRPAPATCEAESREWSWRLGRGVRVMPVWRGARVAEGAGFENRCAGNRTGGSNPSLSVSLVACAL